jgi:hypothetical protein
MPRSITAAPNVKTCKMTIQIRTEHCVCNLVAEMRIIFISKWSTAHGWYELPYSANRWFCTQLLSFLVTNVFNSINCDVTPCNLVVIFQRFGWFYCIQTSQEIKRAAYAASNNAEYVYKHTWNSFCIPSRMYNLYCEFWGESSNKDHLTQTSRRFVTRLVTDTSPAYTRVSINILVTTTLHRPTSVSARI